MLIVPTDNYDPVFYASKSNSNTIDPRKSLIRILNEGKKPKLANIHRYSPTKMGTAYTFCVFCNGHEIFTRKLNYSNKT